MNGDKMKELAPPKYSEEERKKVIQYFMKLKGDLIRNFLLNNDLPTSGTKPELRECIEKYIEEGTLEYKDLVNFLDAVVPWGKQHVFLYDGPETLVEEWRDENFVNKKIKENNISKYLNARLPLILPENLSLSSIEYKSGKKLSVFAVERREYWERNNEYDDTKMQDDLDIQLRAYIHLVIRGVIVFEWDLLSNEATFQILQLPSGLKYEEIEEDFARLIKSWLNLELFAKLDLSPVIKKLHTLEEVENPEARSHGINYKTHGGRTVSARSSTPRDSVLGEQVVNNAMSNIREQGVGNIGNFYWLPSSLNSANNNPLEKEIHTIIVGNKNRVNITTPNKEEDIKYVLSRVRELSR